METQTLKEKTQVEPVFCVHNVNSNFPEKVSSFPAIHLSKDELSPVVWCQVNGIPTGMVR